MEADWDVPEVDDAPEESVASAVDFPAFVLEGLLDAAWSLPGLTVEWARLDGSSLSTIASAGPRPAPPRPASVDLASAPRLLSSLQRTKDTLEIEDLDADSRTQGEPERFPGLRAVYWLPVTPPGPIRAFVMLSSHRPRTWGRKDAHAIERLGPLLGVAHEVLELRHALRESRHRLREEERRRAATCSLGQLIIAELRELLERTTSASSRAAELTEELALVCSDRVGERLTELVDVVHCFDAIAAQAPQLTVEVEPRTDAFVTTHRAGLLRLLHQVVQTWPGALSVCVRGQSEAVECSFSSTERLPALPWPVVMEQRLLGATLTSESPATLDLRLPRRPPID